MKTINVRRTGILHKLASFGGYTYSKHGDDFCAWARRVVLGSLVLAFILLFVLGFTSVLGVSILKNWLGEDYKAGMFFYLFAGAPTGIIALLGSIVCLCFGVGVLSYTINRIPDWTRALWGKITRKDLSGPPHEPSALGSMYAALRGKLCGKLRITD